MTIDLSKLNGAQRLLFEIPLIPVQGQRFQPTGFPGLGAATFQTSNGACLLVESAQSMANRLELTCWDETRQDLKAELQGLSHVRVFRKGAFLTDTILESHRINSPYLLKSKLDQTFFNLIKGYFGNDEMGMIDRRFLARFLLQYDINSLLHGVFVSQSELGGGRLRVPRALSAFIEADDVKVAASGGVKNDQIHPSKVQGDKEGRFGNIPFARDEFTAEKITLYVSLDLAQIRGYGLGAQAENLLILISLFKLRSLVEGNLRLRTACDLRVAGNSITASNPAGFALPALDSLTAAIEPAITVCREMMTVTEVTFNDELKKAKGGDEESSDEATTQEEA